MFSWPDQQKYVPVFFFLSGCGNVFVVLPEDVPLRSEMCQSNRVLIKGR
jgi:hypothetical protein